MTKKRELEDSELLELLEELDRTRAYLLSGGGISREVAIELLELARANNLHPTEDPRGKPTPTR